MIIRQLFAILAAFVVTFAGLTGASFAGNGSTATGDFIVDYSPVEVNAMSAQEIKDYWTPEKMAEALANPLDVVRPDSTGVMPVVSALAAGSQPSFVSGSCADCQTGQPGPTAMSDDPSAQACPTTGYSTWSNTCGSVYPMRLVGKMFIDTPTGSGVCSASLVNGRMIATAAHCVYGSGAWYTNMIFVPAYLNGSEPYGRATITNASVYTSWQTSTNYSRDYSFAILDTWLGSTLGWLGVAYNMLETTQVYAQYGYPAESPYDGSTLYINAALVGSYATAEGSPAPIGIGTSMTPGSSGGPWIIGDTYVNGVTSFAYSSCSYTVYSPYFDASTRDLYDHVHAMQ